MAEVYQSRGILVCMMIRAVCLTFVALLAGLLCFSQPAPDPWPQSAVVQPAMLATSLESPLAKEPVILCVAFPVLYRTKHIRGALFAGPGNKPEGLEELKKVVADLPKDSDIVLYCGCCPMDKCPNMRPAYRTLKELGFTKVRVLNIPTNMHADWYTKNYPSEAGSAAEAPVQR